MARKTKESNKATEELEKEVEKDEDYESLRQKLIDEYNTKKSSEDASEPAQETQEEEDLEDNLEDDDTDYQEEEDSYDEYQEEDPIHNDDSSDSQDLKNSEFDIDKEVNSEPSAENIEGASSDNQNLDNDIKQLYQNTAPDVDQGQSKVAVGNKKNFLVFAIIAIIALFVLYKFFKSANPAPAEPSTQVDTSIPITTPVQDSGQAIVVPQLPKAPEVPKLSAPTPPAAPTPPVVLDLAAPTAAKTPSTDSSNIFNKNNKSELDRKKSKITSSMIVGGGEGKSSNKNTSKSGQSLTILQRNTDQIVATNIGDLRRVIAQGKIIDATLETAINTDIPGSVRALVSRDIFSENGSNVLIPRGSRLIGTYTSNVSFGINRLSITWSRLIRPDGVDINIASPGIDPIGRAGMPGDLNNHIVSTLTAAVLTSIIDVGVAAFADSQTSTDSTTTTFSPTTTSTTSTDATTVTTPTINTGGTVTTGTTPTQTDTAYQSAVSKIGTTGQNIVDQFQNLKPTITIDQGAPLKVFVNKDLVFPGTSANLTKVIE